MVNKCNTCKQNMSNEKTCPYTAKIKFPYGMMMSVERCDEYKLFEKDHQLSKEWCDCGSKIGDDTICMDDNVCSCGISKHHYHCGNCKKIIQIG